MQASQPSAPDTGQSSTILTRDAARCISLVTDKSDETSEKGTHDSSGPHAGLCAIATTRSEDSTKGRDEMKVVRQSPLQAGVHFVHLEKDGEASRIVEEAWCPTPQDMVEWLGKHHDGEEIQWILYPRS